MPCGVGAPLKFLSTLSLRRATVFVCVICQRLAISIHALLAESDNQQGVENMRLSNISIHALLAESDGTIWHNHKRGTISIHALLAESDLPVFSWRCPLTYFYPRSPCGERRWRCSCRRLYSNFYPRSPCGERRHSCRADAGDQPISIHALLAESDAQRQSAQRQPDGFLSTLSLRRATGAATNTRARHLNFYPRSPCGERRNNSNNELVCTVFLSTLSLRRATVRD